MTRPIGGDVASTWPVMMISDIWSVNGISSQKPPPHASTTCSERRRRRRTAATTTMNVARSAKMNASGSQRSAQSVSASAASATGPGSECGMWNSELGIRVTSRRRDSVTADEFQIPNSKFLIPNS